MLRLTGEAPSRGYQRALAAVRPAYHRYALNVVVTPDAIPPAMGPRVFAVMDPTRPLVEENLLAVEVHPPDGPTHLVTVTVEALLARATVEEGDAAMHKVRARILRALGTVTASSGRGTCGMVRLAARRAPARRPRAAYDGGARGAHRVGRRGDGDRRPRRARGRAGTLATPAVGDTRNVLLVGRQAVPGSAPRGVSAALSAARHVTRSDRSKGSACGERLWLESGRVIDAA